MGGPPFIVHRDPQRVRHAGLPSGNFELLDSVRRTVWDAQPNDKWNGAFPASTFGWGRISNLAMKTSFGEVQGYDQFVGGLTADICARIVVKATPFWSTFGPPVDRTATMRVTLMDVSWDLATISWNTKPTPSGPSFEVACQARNGSNDSFSGGHFLIEIPDDGGPYYGIHYEVLEAYEPGPPDITYYVQPGSCWALMLRASG